MTDDWRWVINRRLPQTVRWAVSTTGSPCWLPDGPPGRLYDRFALAVATDGPVGRFALAVATDGPVGRFALAVAADGPVGRFALAVARRPGGSVRRWLPDGPPGRLYDRFALAVAADGPVGRFALAVRPVAVRRCMACGPAYDQSRSQLRSLSH